MGCAWTDIGVLLPNATTLLREGWGTKRIDAALNWLRRENACDAHIFVQSSADWRHFCRLAGFTNQKPGRRLDNGLAPFVRLRERNGHIYDEAEDFLNQIATLVHAI
jgi:hypothetical protein